MNALLVATGNSGKRREFEVLLKDAFGDEVEVFDKHSWADPLPEVVEDGTTFHYNAIKKALETSLACDVSTLADDSGLEVDALQGAPGVFSARFAGEDATSDDNNKQLIEVLQGVPQDQRGARYVAVVVICIDLNSELARLAPDETTECNVFELKQGVWGRHEDRALIWFRGTCEGQIIDEPRGDGGFGYDPYFLIPAWKKTMAEVPLDQKNTISHRSIATKLLAASLSQ